MTPNMPSSGRVDVLQTLDWAAEQVRGRHVCASDAERRRVDEGIREARAAVAELIEAAEGVWNTPRPAGSDPNGRYSKAEKRLAAALANIGAAP